MNEPFFKFSNLSSFPELVHGISTRNDGNMKFVLKNGDTQTIVKNREKFCQSLGISLNSVVAPEIVHSASVLEVNASNLGNGAKERETTIKGADGLLTKEKNINLLVTLADCAAILIYDPVEKTIACVHAGWRGIAEGIGWKTINKFKEMGSRAENLIIGVSPTICQKHFVVKKDILNIFYAKYPKAVFVRNHDGYVDLKKCLHQDFVAAGVSLVNIEIANECTVCDNYYYSSFRQEGDKTIFQAAIIGMK